MSDEGKTALLLAVRSGSLAAVEALLAAGADPSIATTVHQWHPLHVAVRSDPSDDVVPIIKALLAAGAAPDAKGLGDSTPAHWAAHMGNVEALTVLLDAGVPVDIVNNPAHTPLYMACDSFEREAAESVTEVVRLLLQRGATVNPGPQPACSPLHAAARMGKVDVVDLLLAAGAEVDVRDRQGMTPLIKCCAQEGPFSNLLCWQLRACCWQRGQTPTPAVSLTAQPCT